MTQSKKKDLLKIYKACKLQDYEIDFDPSSAATSTKAADTDSLNNESSSSSSSKSNQQRISWMLTDLEKLDSDPIIPHLFDKPLAANSSETNDNEQIPRPQSIFNFYPPQHIDEQLNVEIRLSSEMPCEHASNRLLVKCTQLKFELEIEPVWATMALYDLKVVIFIDD